MTTTANGKVPETLFAALAAFQADLPGIGKGNTASVRSDKGNYSYKYADLADVSAAVLPRLGALGLAFTARPTVLDGQFVLAYSLVHVSGDREDGIYMLPSSGTPQQIGSAITYARRYCLCAAVGVAPAEDDDDAAAAQTVTRQSAADAWDSAKPAPPRQNGSDGNGQQQRGQVSRPAQPQAAGPVSEDAPEDIDPDAQAFADEAHGAISLKEMEDIQRRAREAKKLLLFVRNPSSDGTGKPGKLAIYLDWKRKQVKETEDALTELNAVVDETGFPVAELETHVKSVTGTDLESASAAQLRQAAQAMRVMQEPAA